MTINICISDGFGIGILRGQTQETRLYTNGVNMCVALCLYTPTHIYLAHITPDTPIHYAVAASLHSLRLRSPAQPICCLYINPNFANHQHHTTVAGVCNQLELVYSIIASENQSASAVTILASTAAQLFEAIPIAEAVNGIYESQYGPRITMDTDLAAHRYGDNYDHSFVYHQEQRGYREIPGAYTHQHLKAADVVEVWHVNLTPTLDTEYQNILFSRGRYNRAPYTPSLPSISEYE
jgi:hypothetical protein